MKLSPRLAIPVLLLSASAILTKNIRAKDNNKLPQVIVTPQDGAEMVLIPAGEFKMGSNVRQGEQPVHTVYLPAFYIDKYEVTNKQYEKYVPHYKRTIYSDCDNCPATYISWHEAAAYAKWAGKRLPTEEEWEKAAQGPEGYKYSYGNTYDKSQARVGLTWEDTAVKVGSYAPNGYGVYDMTGNAWEWCADWYNAYEHKLGLADFPRSEIYKVVRGGAWGSDDYFSRTAKRFKFEPHIRFFSVGFRLAKTPK
jgi:formylglycine-generating enzyme required for sulfatase activity